MTEAKRKTKVPTESPSVQSLAREIDASALAEEAGMQMREVRAEEDPHALFDLATDALFEALDALYYKRPSERAEMLKAETEAVSQASPVIEEVARGMLGCGNFATMIACETVAAKARACVMASDEPLTAEAREKIARMAEAFERAAAAGLRIARSGRM